MKNFLKPTKVTWWVFGVLLIITAFVYFVWFFLRDISLEAFVYVVNNELWIYFEYLFEFLFGYAELLGWSVVEFLYSIGLPLMEYKNCAPYSVTEYNMLATVFPTCLYPNDLGDNIIFTLGVAFQLIILYLLSAIISRIWYSFKVKS